LQEKLKAEAELHFHDSQPQWFAIADRDSVAAEDLALHSKSCLLKEAFHNRVKRGLRHAQNLRHQPASLQERVERDGFALGHACEHQIGNAP
jgi:hypothetical protein